MVSPVWEHKYKESRWGLVDCTYVCLHLLRRKFYKAASRRVIPTPVCILLTVTLSKGWWLPGVISQHVLPTGQPCIQQTKEDIFKTNEREKPQQDKHCWGGEFLLEKIKQAGKQATREGIKWLCQTKKTDICSGLVSIYPSCKLVERSALLALQQQRYCGPIAFWFGCIHSRFRIVWTTSC